MMQRQSVRSVHGDRTQETSQSQPGSQAHHILGANQPKLSLSNKSSSHLASRIHMKQNEQVHSSPCRITENDTNLQVLHSKLQSETENILKWKVSTELEMSEKERKLLEAEEIVERQRKNLFELQMHSEQLSQRLQVELKNREELSSKIENTRNICGIIRDHCNKLTSTVNVCVDEKENLKSMYSQQHMDVKELKERFEAMDAQFRMEMDQMEDMVKEERTQRNKVISEANALHNILNEKIDELNKKYAVEQENTEQLSHCVKQYAETIKGLETEKEEILMSLSSIKNQVVELEHQIASQKLKFDLDMKETMLTLEQERSRYTLLHSQLADAQENLTRLHAKEGELLSENKDLKKSMNNLEAAHHDLNEELHRTSTSLSKTLAENDRLLVELKGLEESHIQWQALKIDYDKLMQEKNLAVKELRDANEKFASLENSKQEIESVLMKYRDENEKLINELGSCKESEDSLREKLTTAESLEQEMRQNVEFLVREVDDLRHKLSSLESESALNASDLNALIEEEKTDSLRKDGQLKTLNEEVKKLECIIAQLREDGESYLEQIKKLDEENKAFKKLFDDETEKVDALNQQIQKESGQNEELSKSLQEVTDQAIERAKVIDKFAVEKQELEEKLDNLQDLLEKTSQERNSFELKFQDTIKERDAIQNKSDSEIKEMVAVLEKYKRECDGIVGQKEASITKLSSDLNEIHKIKDDLEEQVMKLQKENNSTLRKMADLEKEKDIVEKTLQVKVMDLELKLTAKDKEMAEKEVAMLKNEVVKSPYVEKVFSTPLRKHSLGNEDRNVLHTPKSGISPAPLQMKCSPRHNPSILKEPNTPGGHKKQVTFQEDTSDTDASSVDAMILDNSDLLSRFEALERGVKMMTPIRVFPSPKNRRKMELKKAEMQVKNEENNPDYGSKKARMMRNKPGTDGVNLKGNMYQDGCDMKNLLKSTKLSDKEKGRNTGLDLDELFEIIED
ncbi:myosin-13-like [Ischnura elegans]|uniref:myosin-13-like n=1 Tax=Ischnura elegans TaxID=197161 RepID=UPI001ED8817D|nr:myosin-13-like [Ischnura elegans]